MRNNQLFKQRKSFKKRKSFKQRKSFKKKKSFKKRKSIQKGGFIGTMFNLALTPIKLVSKPLFNMLSKSNSSSMSNSNSNSNLPLGTMSGSGLDESMINSIKMNNSNIGALKQLSMYGYDNRTLSSYINQLHHINI